MGEEIKETTETTEKKKGKWKIILVVALTVLLAGGAWAGIHFVSRSVGYFTTDNARVTTDLFAITPPVPGVLERFTAFEGMYVQENDILGWVQNSPAMRSPVDGMVIFTNAVQDQIVSGHEPVAVVADMNNLHVQANVEETDISRLRVGMDAIVTIDTFGSRRFNGYVAEIGRITHGELTGSAMFFNTGGTFTRVTHLIPVRINITDDVELDSLIGVNARVRIPVAGDADFHRQEATDGITVRGAVESAASRTVYTTLGLTVERVYVQEGDYVTEGQVLAMLDVGDLELSIAQQRATLEATRQSTQNALTETRRLYAEASANLANNTNMHVISAEATLNAANVGLDLARQNYDNAAQDYREQTNPHVLAAESALRTIEAELATMEEAHRNTQTLYDAGVVTREELRQVQAAFTHIQNQYNDARVGAETAAEIQRRTLEQLRGALQAAEAAQLSARELLNAATAAARQEAEMLRGSVAAAEIAANMEPMEIALELMERQLENAAITSPISGTVTAAIARQGAVGMGPLFVVEDIDSLRIITSFREYDIGRIQTGMEVVITADAGGTQYSGIISRINPAATPGLPVVEFEAEILVTTPETGLRVGMGVRVDVEG